MTNAIRVHETGGPDVLRWESIDVDSPRPGEATIRHTAIGLNFIDTYHRSGVYSLPSFPHVLGVEAAGVVEAVGADVSGLVAGQKKGGLNDFVIRIATVNGTGSASANGLLMKAIFRMGVPVSAKNFFPSNIQGLPTWFEIRVNRDGYKARAGRVDVMVAMNAETYREDLAAVTPGGVFIYDNTWPRQGMLVRDDVTVLGRDDEPAVIREVHPERETRHALRQFEATLDDDVGIRVVRDRVAIGRDAAVAIRDVVGVIAVEDDIDTGEIAQLQALPIRAVDREEPLVRLIEGRDRVVGLGLRPALRTREPMGGEDFVGIEIDLEHPIEKVGAELRGRMDWLEG